MTAVGGTLDAGSECDNDAAYFAVLAEHATAWRRRWPAHCTRCDGWGGKSFQETHGGPWGSETMFDQCEALPANQCHRCGSPGLTEDSEGPCMACGWDYNDGAPG